MGEQKCREGFGWGKLRVRHHLDDLDIERIILN
jgi:hypothetical protein